MHPNAFTSRYTFNRVVYIEYVADEASARAREKQIKGWTRAKKVALIQRDNPHWEDILPSLERLFQ